MSARPNLFRRAIHTFVYGLCGAFIGITPPNEKQELPFFFILIGFLTFTVLALYALVRVLSSFS